MIPDSLSSLDVWSILHERDLGGWVQTTQVRTDMPCRWSLYGRIY